jgi:hypothetical protein
MSLWSRGDNVPDNPFDWVRIPPRDKDESPEEIRRQRDLYRDMVDAMILKEWENVRPEDLQFDSRSQEEIHAIIAELRAGPKS